ncbi:hypothetical protein RJ640_021509 [Escallonia rubra]|uniref:Zinc finger LSD1-type domain-containing protein n=1 Tax=Escallonia rubra TaxID=112253 RepID=A0AA88QP24_9ASTE|nr:hypothetical protein RJ640_021509 [Escallonia rubra]
MFAVHYATQLPRVRFSQLVLPVTLFYNVGFAILTVILTVLHVFIVATRFVAALPKSFRAGMDMSQLICGGCRTLLMHARGATSVRCSCCHTVNLVPEKVNTENADPGAPVPHNLAHVNCGNCRTMLMYPYGAQSVKCAVCQHVTNVHTYSSRLVKEPCASGDNLCEH